MNEIVLPEPIAIDAETVTLARQDWEAHVAQLEDATDIRALELHRAWTASVGGAATRRLSYTVDETRRILDGASTLVIWRERAGLTQRALASLAGIGGSYLAEIEGGKKPGSATALAKLARALEVPMEYLVPEGH